MKIDQWLEEVGRFADIDAPLQADATTDCWIARFRQNGDDVEVVFHTRDGSIVERRGQNPVRYGSHKGLLASSHFGNLALLARLQRSMAENDRVSPSSQALAGDIPIAGDINSGVISDRKVSLLDKVDDWTVQPLPEGSGVRALVIDGPAGIGKTHLIRALVFRRAQAYGPGCKPLMLHVQSRGRQLTTLPYLLAGTLQSMRLSLMYDQIPVLIRHGLIQIAIDGFDELADPNGYETAWHSLNDFISDIGSNGVVLLAGRDTFIDAKSVKKALPGLAEENVGAAHLRVPSASEAIDWLRGEGLDDKKISLLQGSGLFDEGSYSLRPFFLRQIRSIAESQASLDLLASFPLRMLVEAMIQREAPLAAKLVPSLNLIEIEELLKKLLSETARDMADYESESIDLPSLQLLAEITFGGKVKEESLRAIKNRVKSIALLELDNAAERRRFVHTEIQAYFLALAYIDLLAQDEYELARSLRRNIVGSDFLEVFHDVCQFSDKGKLAKFRTRALEIVKSRRYDDRAIVNVSSLLLASANIVLPDVGPVILEDVAVDDCLLRGIVEDLKVFRSSFSQFDVRGTDLSGVEFRDTHIASLIVDAVTVLPVDFPVPAVLVLDVLGEQVRFFAPEDIIRILRVLNGTDIDKPRIVAMGGAGKLLDKICRIVLRQTWIRQTGDDRAARLLDDPYWPDLRILLQKHGLLEENDRKQASGQGSTFIRIRHAKELLDPRSKLQAAIDIRSDLEKMT